MGLINPPVLSTAFTSVIPIHAHPTSSLIWTSMPATATEFASGTGSRLKWDLTNATQYRIIVNQVAAGVAGADINFQYSTDQSNWFACDTGAAGELEVGTTLGVRVGAWADIVTAAKQDVFVRLLGKDGNGSASPQFREVHIQIKYVVPVTG